jgi:uncharacterized membrane protein
MSEIKERTYYIDFLRGSAILIMLLANLSPLFFNAQTPMVVRMIYSMAAPIFIFLSGYSAFAFSHSNYFSFWRVLFAAVFVDACIWRLPPFHSFDVLYVLSITILSTHLFKKSKAFVQHLLFALVFLAWIICAQHYRFPFNKEPFSIQNSFIRFFIDGWFPILPWILFGWTGAYFARYQWNNLVLIKYIGLAFFIYGSTTLYLHPLNPAREKYLEIFYPVTLPYMSMSLGLIIVLLSILNSWSQYVSSTNLLCIIGRNALFAYILHYAFIVFVVSNLHLKNTVALHLITWGILATLIFLLCYAKEKWIADGKKLPILVRLVSGL